MSDPKTAHLTLRLTPDQIDLITQAASQAGVTLTQFVTVAAEARAHRMFSGEVMYLDAEQSRRVAESLQNPGEPNAALRDLLARPHHQEAAVLPAEVTLHQAAELLNVSPSYVKGLLDEGSIAHHGEGAHLRVDRDALLAYKARDDQERQAVLDELTREAQEQGCGY